VANYGSECLQKILEKFEKMTPEEYKQLFDKVQKDIREIGESGGKE